MRESSPIALHINCRASVLDKNEDWSDELLGIETGDQLKNTVKRTLNDFEEEFAVFFLKAKGVL